MTDQRPIKANYVRRYTMIRGVEYETIDALPETEMLAHTNVQEQMELDQAGNAVRTAYGEQPRKAWRE